MLEAVTHSSFANESPQLSPRDNERLEYLGDAVLQLISAEYLYKHYPGAAEGELTQTRSAMVNTNTLAQLAEQLDLGSYLYLGKGIAKGGGRSLKSLLANAFEAVLGAMFLDAGYDAAYHYYLDRYRALPDLVRDENFKGRLQQVAQERFGETPVYESEGARVGDRREYTSVVFAGPEPSAPAMARASRRPSRVRRERPWRASSARSGRRPPPRWPSRGPGGRRAPGRELPPSRPRSFPWSSRTPPRRPPGRRTRRLKTLLSRLWIRRPGASAPEPAPEHDPPQTRSRQFGEPID